MDLFSAKLDAITVRDVEAFLALNSPENDRLPEGTRIDYKEHLPSDIADDVAALANTYGGLIFVGVTPKLNSVFRQNIPAGVPGTTSLGSDAKARITSKIVTSVHPVPNFDIGVCGTGISGQMLAVIRVEQGTEPPYESTIGGKYRIPIRAQDSKRQASLAEIERFLNLRESGRRATTEVLSRWENQQQGNDYQRALLAPIAPLRLRVDLLFEKQFRALLDPTEKTLTGQERSGDTYTVTTAGKKFLVDDQGNLGFASSLSRRGSPGEWVGDPIDELSTFLLFAYRFFDRYRYHGNFTLAHAMSCYSVTFLAYFQVPNDKYESQAVSFPPRKSAPSKEDKGFRRIDVAWSSFNDPSEIVAEIMLYQLRHLRQANVDYEKLVLEIRGRLIKQ